MRYLFPPFPSFSFPFLSLINIIQTYCKSLYRRYGLVTASSSVTYLFDVSLPHENVFKFLSIYIVKKLQYNFHQHFILFLHLNKYVDSGQFWSETKRTTGGTHSRSQQRFPSIFKWYYFFLFFKNSNFLKFRKIIV